ncbi:hypothetical protein [Thermococcus sp. JCM 11816]|uniref:hypothetical protein n=1 Tax=Thermococcus sp. (strain JCM 11816 / KS-1) TaxID=1295125 RepID=UPI000A9F6C6A
MSIDGLLEVVKALNVELSLPSELKHSGRKLYLRTSSWAPDKSLRIWTEDEGERSLEHAHPPFVGEPPLAFLAENSDARGWEPLPERRLDAFRAIYNDWRGGSK